MTALRPPPRRSPPSFLAIERDPPSLFPFHPNNHAYSFRCFTNDPSKRAPRLTTFRRSCRDHLELAPCVRPAFLLSPFPFSHFSPKRLFFPQFPYMRGSFLEKEGRFSRERRRSIHDAFFPPSGRWCVGNRPKKRGVGGGGLLAATRAG